MMSHAGQAEKKTKTKKNKRKLLKSLISTCAVPEERPRPVPKPHKIFSPMLSCGIIERLFGAADVVCPLVLNIMPATSI